MMMQKKYLTIQHPFLIKTVTNLGIEENVPNLRASTKTISVFLLININDEGLNTHINDEELNTECFSS